MPVRVLVLRAPGTNCDLEAAHAFELAGGQSERIHINRLLDHPEQCADFQILCVPGGFSYGDDIAAGRILGNQMWHHLADAMREFKEAGKLILGICNGFQVLIKSPGVLLDDDPQAGPAATLTWNESAKFEDRWVPLRTSSSKCVFLSGIESMYLPVAHAEGKFVARDAAMLNQLEQNGQLVLRYAASGVDAVSYPENPNGAQANVAGLCDTTGRVLGLMPHPERHVDPTQHPHWSRRDKQPPEGEGLAMFRNAVRFFS